MKQRKLRAILNACLFGIVGSILIDYFGFPNISFGFGIASALTAGGAYFWHQHQIAKRQKNR